MNPAFPFAEFSFNFVWPIAEHLFPSLGVKDFIGDYIPVPDAIIASFDGKMPAFFAFLKFCFNFAFFQYFMQFVGYGLYLDYIQISVIR